MKKRIVLVFALLAIVGSVGCGTATTPTPAATPTAMVVTVVITATPPPPTATSPAPTITPVPTLPITPTVAAATPSQVAVRATVAPPAGTARPSATRRVTAVPATPTVTPVPIKFAAPQLIGPKFNDTQKDERHFPADALIFEWRGVGGLAGDECYSVDVSFEPGARDQFLWECGEGETQVGYPLKKPFRLNRPNEAGPNYSGLLPQASEIWVYWTVTVVKRLGQKPDGKYNAAPISPVSERVRFLLKGN